MATEPDSETPLEPLGFLLASRNMFALVILAQFFLLINGAYLYNISQAAAVVYLFGPVALITYMLNMTKLTNGRPVTWEMLERSMLARRDKLSAYLKKAGWSAGYFSVGVQLIYFSLGFLVTYTALLVVVTKGYLTVQEINPIDARNAIIMTLVLVAPSETLIFHATVPLWAELTFKKSQYCLILTYIISQTIFALFHYSAYGGSTGSMIFAFFMGVVFLWVARSYGIPAAVGTHAAWNLIILGVGSAPLLGA